MPQACLKDSNGYSCQARLLLEIM
eukprot:SAG31_NODE_17597_length_665_cov_0.733216_1_plen_23_part_10